MPPTALPAPDIEIGLRHPVNYILARQFTDECDPFHNRRKKVPANLSLRCFGGIQSAVLTRAAI